MKERKKCLNYQAVGQCLGRSKYTKAVAPHSSPLAWKIPWTEEPGGAAVHGVMKSWTRLSDLTFTFHFHALEKEMATHSSILAWEIPWTEEPGGLYIVHGAAKSQTHDSVTKPPPPQKKPD